MAHSLSNDTAYDSVNDWVETFELEDISHTQIPSLAQQLMVLKGKDWTIFWNWQELFLDLYDWPKSGD
jgi:hypothetical protein